MVQTHNERETICETKIEEQKHSIQSCMEICLTWALKCHQKKRKKNQINTFSSMDRVAANYL